MHKFYIQPALGYGRRTRTYTQPKIKIKIQEICTRCSCSSTSNDTVSMEKEGVNTYNVEYILAAVKLIITFFFLYRAASRMALTRMALTHDPPLYHKRMTIPSQIPHHKRMTTPSQIPHHKRMTILSQMTIPWMTIRYKWILQMQKAQG